MPNGVLGIDVLAEIVPERTALERSAARSSQICAGCGKSRGVYVVAKGRAFVIDSATYWGKWQQVEPIYDRIIGSFTLGR